MSYSNVKGERRGRWNHSQTLPDIQWWYRVSLTLSPSVFREMYPARFALQTRKVQTLWELFFLYEEWYKIRLISSRVEKHLILDKFQSFFIHTVDESEKLSWTSVSSVTVEFTSTMGNCSLTGLCPAFRNTENKTSQFHRILQSWFFENNLEPTLLVCYLPFFCFCAFGRSLQLFILCCVTKTAVPQMTTWDRLQKK